MNTSGWIGLLSFLAYKLYLMAGGGIVGGNFLGALLIGILSMQAARWLKMPVINFNIPSLVPFVPGGQAYQMVKKTLPWVILVLRCSTSWKLQK